MKISFVALSTIAMSVKARASDTTTGSSSLSSTIRSGDSFVKRNLQGYTSSNCTAGFIECVNGMVSGTSTTCAQACLASPNGTCCEGTDACKQFTGKVCLDGSCSDGGGGLGACSYTRVDEVINSCKGFESCHAVANQGGNSRLVDSCLGYRACWAMAYKGGTVGDLINSCHSIGETTSSAVCYRMGRVGSVGNVINSCFGEATCNHLGAAMSGSGGEVGDIINSCGSQPVLGNSTDAVNDDGVSVMGNRNCFKLEYQGGSTDTPVTAIADCCNDGGGDYQCSSSSSSGYVQSDEDLYAKDPTCDPAYIPPPTTESPTMKPTPSPTVSTPPPTVSTPPPTVGVADEWTIVHNATASGADFTANGTGTDGNGIVTSDWTFKAPDLTSDTTADTYKLKTIIKAGFCSGPSSTVDTKTVDSTMVSGGLITDTMVEDGGVGENGTCALDDQPGGSEVNHMCKYQFDKSSMNESVGYYAASAGSTTSYQKLCEIAQVQWNNFVVVEKYVNIEIQYDTSAGFEVKGVGMTAATIQDSSQDAKLSDYLNAFKCDADDTATAENPSTAKLAPNDELYICLESSSPDVLIDEVTSMEIKGFLPNSASSTQDSDLSVIGSGSIPTFKAITSITGVDTKKVTVVTRLPNNKFFFESDDPAKAQIDILGSVLLKFTGGRKLAVELPSRMLQVNEDETAVFDVVVTLQNENEDLGLNGYSAMMNSAKAIGGNAFAIGSMVLASAFGLW